MVCYLLAVSSIVEPAVDAVPSGAALFEPLLFMKHFTIIPMSAQKPTTLNATIKTMYITVTVK